MKNRALVQESERSVGGSGPGVGLEVLACVWIDRPAPATLNGRYGHRGRWFVVGQNVLRVGRRRRRRLPRRGDAASTA